MAQRETKRDILNTGETLAIIDNNSNSKAANSDSARGPQGEQNNRRPAAPRSNTNKQEQERQREGGRDGEREKIA